MVGGLLVQFLGFGHSIATPLHPTLLSWKFFCRNLCFLPLFLILPKSEYAKKRFTSNHLEFEFKFLSNDLKKFEFFWLANNAAPVVTFIDLTTITISQKYG